MLQIGDSFAFALGRELVGKLRTAGVLSRLVYKDASYVPTWASTPDLPSLLDKYEPDLVLVTLGANELEIPEPLLRAGAVERLVKRLGDRSCVWVLPPVWKPDTGFLQVIKDHAAPCRVLDSSALVPDLPRARDHIHPNRQGSEIWATAVFEWLKRARRADGARPWELVDAPL